MREHDVVYIPRYCYSLVPFAKRLGKKVFVHLHDYQPISYNATVFSEAKGDRSSPNVDAVKFELLEHGSALRPWGLDRIH